VADLKHIDLEGLVYFVTTSTNKREKIFSNAKFAQVVVDAFQFGRKRDWFLLLGFVVMPDHIHIAVVPQKRKIPEIAKGIKGYTARKINNLMNKKGRLWQKGYRDFVMDDMEAINQKLRYIEENPVRAGLAYDMKAYPFSSAGKYDQLDLEYLA
jgi:REP element-mobilizing transposase RayT